VNRWPFPGVCLTVAEVSPSGFNAVASEETLARTTLGSVRLSGPLNLERALKVSDRLGGHIVSGHVDGKGHLVSRTPIGAAQCLTFAFPRELARYFAEKGSVTVDGVSLTINRVSATDFDVAVIPHTESVTTLGTLKAGSPVNLEVDVLARYLERLLVCGGGGGGTYTPNTQEQSAPAASGENEEHWHKQSQGIRELLKNKGYL
jgi:riboflavin synthase